MIGAYAEGRGTALEGMMSELLTVVRSEERDDVAPDGSDVRILARVDAGGTAEFSLAPDCISRAVRHRTIEEVWFVIEGRGSIWRKRGDLEEVTNLAPGTSVTIPVGTSFQFRSTPGVALRILGATMPPWPGDGESIPVTGLWTPTV